MFARNRARGGLAAQATSRLDRVASTPQQVFEAIAAIAAIGATSPLAVVGSCIRIAAPMCLDDTIVIPPTCPGLRIYANSYLPITATRVISTLFDVQAELVAIDGLFVYADDVTKYFTTFVTLSGNRAAGRSSEFCRIERNHLFVDRVLVDASAGDSAEGFLVDNVHASNINGAHAATVSIASPRWTVRGNRLRDSGGDTITLGATANRCRVNENDFGGGDLTSSASGGSNVITDNVRDGGTIFPAGTDVVADNQ